MSRSEVLCHVCSGAAPRSCELQDSRPETKQGPGLYDRSVRSRQVQAPREGHLRLLVREYVEHYDHERNHQGLDNQLLQRAPPPAQLTHADSPTRARRGTPQLLLSRSRVKAGRLSSPYGGADLTYVATWRGFVYARARCPRCRSSAVPPVRRVVPATTPEMVLLPTTRRRRCGRLFAGMADENAVEPVGTRGGSPTALLLVSI